MEPKELIEKTLENLHVPALHGVPEMLARFLGELERWNARINLVGVKDTQRLCRELLADALFLNSYVNDRRRLADIGSGSGILGVPIAILNKDVDVYSVDGNLKKVQFQRHIRRELGLANFFPIHGRTGTIDPLAADGLVAKAFGTTLSILEAAERHLGAGGKVFIVKGKGEKENEYRGYRLEKALPYTLPGVDKTYMLFIYKKVS